MLAPVVTSLLMGTERGDKGCQGVKVGSRAAVKLGRRMWTPPGPGVSGYIPSRELRAKTGHASAPRDGAVLGQPRPYEAAGAAITKYPDGRLQPHTRAETWVKEQSRGECCLGLGSACFCWRESVGQGPASVPTWETHPPLS